MDIENNEMNTEKKDRFKIDIEEKENKIKRKHQKKRKDKIFPETENDTNKSENSMNKYTSNILKKEKETFICDVPDP